MSGANDSVLLFQQMQTGCNEKFLLIPRQARRACSFHVLRFLFLRRLCRLTRGRRRRRLKDAEYRRTRPAGLSQNRKELFFRNLSGELIGGTEERGAFAPGTEECYPASPSGVLSPTHGWKPWNLLCGICPCSGYHQLEGMTL